MKRIILLVICCFLAVIKADSSEVNNREIIYLQPNITELFFEFYKAYGLLPIPQKVSFNPSIYLDQSTPETILPLQPSNQAVFNRSSNILSLFHQRVGDLELYIDPNAPKPFFYTGSGSKHLIVALVYAIVMSEPEKKFLFVQKAPYYSGHRTSVAEIFKYPNARYFTFHDPLEIEAEPGEILVEFVTSPNNPDGKFRKPDTDAKIIIADFAFASSAYGEDATGYLEQNLEWVQEARSQKKHVFSINTASKQFGLTGARCGYIWYPMHDPYAALIFKKFYNFISQSTVGGGTIGMEEFLNLIKVFLSLEDNGKHLREQYWKSLVIRHKLVEKEIKNRYPGSVVTSIPSSPTFFAKIKDERIPEKNASLVLFEDFALRVNNGKSMGETDEFIRLNLCGPSQAFVNFLNRLAGKELYSITDVTLLPISK